MAEPWTTEKIREAFIYDGGEAEYHDPEHGAQTQRRIAGDIFDRWLAAHDARKRAEWEAEQGEVEWEYGVTTKWGIHEHPHLEGAERYAAAVRDEIENGRASGDLEYHGRVMKRTKAKVGEWAPVNENGETP